MDSLLDPLQRIGHNTLNIFARLGRAHLLLVQILAALVTTVPRWRLILQQIYSVGVL